MLSVACPCVHWNPRVLICWILKHQGINLFPDIFYSSLHSLQTSDFSHTLKAVAHLTDRPELVVVHLVLFLRLRCFLSRAALLVLIMLLCLDWEKEAEQAKQYASLANEEEAIEEQEEAGGDQFSDALSLPPSPTLRHISIGECFPIHQNNGRVLKIYRVLHFEELQVLERWLVWAPLHWKPVPEEILTLL